MEQFASNFPIANNISTANVEQFVRPTYNTDKSLSGPEAGLRGAGQILLGCLMESAGGTAKM